MQAMMRNSGEMRERQSLQELERLYQPNQEAKRFKPSDALASGSLMPDQEGSSDTVTVEENSNLTNSVNHRH